MTDEQKRLLDEIDSLAGDIRSTQDVLNAMCRLQAVGATVVGYSYASDCFCGAGRSHQRHRYAHRDYSDGYRHHGESIRWLAEVVRDALTPDSESTPQKSTPDHGEG